MPSVKIVLKIKLLTHFIFFAASVNGLRRNEAGSVVLVMDIRSLLLVVVL